MPTVSKLARAVFESQSTVSSLQLGYHGRPRTLLYDDRTKLSPPAPQPRQHTHTQHTLQKWRRSSEDYSNRALEIGSVRNIHAGSYPTAPRFASDLPGAPRESGWRSTESINFVPAPEPCTARTTFRRQVQSEKKKSHITSLDISSRQARNYDRICTGRHYGNK